jgi:hypothetical protein
MPRSVTQSGGIVSHDGSRSRSQGNRGGRLSTDPAEYRMGDLRSPGVSGSSQPAIRIVLRRGVALLAPGAAMACVSIILPAAGARWWMPSATTGPIAEGGLPVLAPGNAHLTNAFGQALCGAAMGVFLWSAACGGLPTAAVALTTLMRATAVLSHSVTATVGACILGAAGLTLAAGRSRGIGLAAFRFSGPLRVRWEPCSSPWTWTGSGWAWAALGFPDDQRL